MRPRFSSDPQDPFSDFGTGENGFAFAPSANGSPDSLGGTGTPSTSAPPQPIAPILPDESFEAMAAVSGSGSGGPGSVVAVTSSSGFTINLIFDSAAMAAPASFRAGIQQAAAILSATITDKITVNINIDYSGTGGGAAAGPDSGQFVNYSTVRSDLIANAAPGDTSFNALPTGSTIQGQSQVAVWNAQLKLFGLISPNDTTTDDASATFATDINPGLLVGVALHELTHAMGRVPYGSQPDIFDFYRFTSAGTRLFTDNIPASSAYFSLNGGSTKIADFGVSSDPSDFLNSGVQGSNDPFNEFYSGSTLQNLTAIDKEMLDALGFNTLPAGIAVVANSAEAVQGGSAVTLLSAPPAISDPGTLASATIKIANSGGSAVAGDELFVNGIENGSLGSGVTASWNATTDTLTLSGSAAVSVYDTLLSEVTFQDTGNDASSGSHPVRTVTWIINDGTNSFNTTSSVAIDRAPAATNDTAVNAVGTTLSTTAGSGLLANDSDLDGDRLSVTGISHGGSGGTIGTALAGTYGHLTLNADGSYSYVADNSTAIGSAPTGVHLQDAFTYTASDGNGGTTNATLTITLDRLSVVTASNVTLSADHTAVAASSLFSVTDPDGDAITAYAFEDTGSGHFVLNGVVEPNNQEIDVTAAQLSQLTYQGSLGAIDTLQIRAEDSSSIWGQWTSFTVTTPLVIQTDVSTSLVEVAGIYFLEVGGTGPILKYGGAVVTANGLGAWTPIGAIQTASGFDVAFDLPGANQYTVWSTDSNGNFVSNLTNGVVSGTNPVLESLEITFHQDLNGDGTIGTLAVVIQTDVSTSLVEAGGNYYLEVGGTGPALAYGGAVVTTSGLGAWTPIGAIQTGSGYDVAFDLPGANQYTVWSTDSNGNFVSNLTNGVVSGTNAVLESLETTFHQDLNGDGTIGTLAVVIQTDVSTSLVEVAGNYFLEVGGTGPILKYGGAVVTTSGLGAWTPIGAIQTGSGFDVAFDLPGANQYTAWSTDSNGNFVSNLTNGVVSGTSGVLESLETTFHQDLNGDGTIGTLAIVIQTDVSTSLVEAGGNYFLEVGGTGPALAYGGAVVTTSGLGAWTPIGAIQTGSGFDVAFDLPGANQYTVWSTDSNGNFVSNLTNGVVSGTNAGLESLEATFHQDLNGDGTIGTLLQTDVSTSLVEAGGNYYLEVGGTGPILKYGGAVVTTSGLGAWTPIGAIQTGSGFDVAFDLPGANQYTVWSTDSNGNFVSNLTNGVGSGTNAVLESLESTFHQDLNGDGTIGISVAPSTTLQITSSFPIAVGAATIGAGATLELNTADSASITFSSSTGMLKLDSLTAFTGVIDNFTGNGSLSGSDQIDLKGINFNSVHDSYSNGVLTVTDGTNTATLDFNGTYVLANFKFASDGGGGTIVYDPPVSAQPQYPSVMDHTTTNNAAGFFAGAGQDSFVFAQAHGSTTGPTTDAGHNNPGASWDATTFSSDHHHDGTYRPAFMADSTHDAMPAHQLPDAQFHAHLGDFHIV
jgi:VCBS repeat-containing protein